MGTDIHLQVQRRNGEGTWETMYPSLGYNEHDHWLAKNYKEAVAKLPEGVTAEDVLNGRYNDKFSMDTYYIKTYHQSWYNGRNYSLFAMLADVRNGHGFAGVQTGIGFNPIAEQRGLPDGIVNGKYDKETNEYSSFNYGDHSFSHLTLKELLDYDWDQTTMLCCYIPLNYYAVRKETGDTNPPLWGSGGIYGRDIEMIDADEADRLLAQNPGIVSDAQREAVYKRLKSESKNYINNEFGTIEPFAKKYYVREWWTETYRDCAGDFYTYAIPEMQKLDPNPENIRLVFGFDS